MIKTFKTVGMTENRFWELVKLAQWSQQDSEDSTEDCRIMYRKLLSIQECSDFRDSVGEAFGILDHVADQKISGVGDDSYGDLLYHIIGLGKKTFYNCANHVRKIQKMADEDKYKESFAYCIPSDDDYKANGEYTIHSVIKIAKAAIKEINRFQKMDSGPLINKLNRLNTVKWLDPIDDDLDRIKIILLNFLDFALKAPQDSLSTLIKTKDWVLKARAKIDKFFEDNYMELPRKFTEPDDDGNDFHGMCTALISNTIDDAEKVLKFLTTTKE